jgi:hypothetical protein
MLKAFIHKIQSNIPVSFEETMTVIASCYDYTPTDFYNGLEERPLFNRAGQNEGSCKIFAFAKLNGLTEQQTLALFGDYYRIDVLSNPDGLNHQNIRHFMRYGWSGMRFAGEPLTRRKA